MVKGIYILRLMNVCIDDRYKITLKIAEYQHDKEYLGMRSTSTRMLKCVLNHY